MINLTQTAIREINRLRMKRKSGHDLFRLKIEIGGCSDFLYTMTFAPRANPEDQTYTCESIQVVIDANSLPYVQGLTIDYSEDLMGGGFRFRNPNAVKHCGCGNSFAVSTPSIEPLL